MSQRPIYGILSIMRGQSRRRLSIAGAVLVASCVAGGVALAVSSASGSIQSCVDKKSGVLRVLVAGAKPCDSKKEQPLEWNQAGPAGIGDVYITAGRFHFIDLPKAQSTP